MRVLLIKMSSLGDVVHALAPITDATRSKPGVIFDWVVEEAYRDIPKWHPTVDRVIVAPLRRWRKAPFTAVRSREWHHFRAELRRRKYDLVLDAQGLLKSVFVAKQTRSHITGRSRQSIREPLASFFYDRHIEVDLSLSEVEQLRQLFARALDYPVPSTGADFGLRRENFKHPTQKRYAVFLHGAAWPAKLWPEDRWIAVAQHVARTGLEVYLPCGSEEEHKRATRIAQEVQGKVLSSLGIHELATVIANAEFVVGLDTGLTHIAVALGVPTVTLYGPSVPVYDRIAHGDLVNLCSTDSRTVDTQRPNAVPVTSVIAAVSRWTA